MKKYYNDQEISKFKEQHFSALLRLEKLQSEVRECMDDLIFTSQFFEESE